MRNGRWSETRTTGEVAVIQRGVSEKHGIKQEAVRIATGMSIEPKTMKIRHKLVFCLKLFDFFVKNIKFLDVRLMCLKNTET